MVSTKTKINYSAEKLKRGSRALLPLFSREHPEDLVSEILREDENIRTTVLMNPEYRALLEHYVKKTFKDYKGIITGGKIVDSWDRVTSGLGLVADAAGPFTGGTGNLASALEEIPELIPKAIYAIYYLTKTGDYKAIPHWGKYEAASFIPGVGDLIDMTNIYIDRARKATKEKVKKDFKKVVAKNMLN